MLTTIGYRCLIALLLFGTIANADATTWDSKTAGEYYNEAEIVARVKIFEAAVIEGGPLSGGASAVCSARYVAKPIDVLKGEVGSSIVFYGHAGKRLMEDYLVFLAAEPVDNPMVTTNSVSMDHQQEVERACKDRVPGGLHSNEFAQSRIYFAWNPATREMEDWAESGLFTFPTGDFPERHEIKVGVIEFDRQPVAQQDQHLMQHERFPIPFDVWGFGGAVRWTEFREYILGSAKMDGRYTYPMPDSSPNLVDRDPETYKVIPKSKRFRGGVPVK